MHIIDKSYEGEYLCKVSNVKGDVEKKIKIIVTGKLQFFDSFRETFFLSFNSFFRQVKQPLNLH